MKSTGSLLVFPDVHSHTHRIFTRCSHAPNMNTLCRHQKFSCLSCLSDATYSRTYACTYIHGRTYLSHTQLSFINTHARMYRCVWCSQGDTLMYRCIYLLDTHAHVHICVSHSHTHSCPHLHRCSLLRIYRGTLRFVIYAHCTQNTQLSLTCTHIVHTQHIHTTHTHTHTHAVPLTQILLIQRCLEICLICTLYTEHTSVSHMHTYTHSTCVTHTHTAVPTCTMPLI